MFDQFLERLGVTYEELSAAERETLHTWLEELKKGQLTLDKVREYISQMREEVSLQIAKEPSFIRIFIFKVENPQLIRLQARLQNYITLEAMLSTPEKAKQQIEERLVTLKREKVA